MDYVEKLLKKGYEPVDVDVKFDYDEERYTTGVYSWSITASNRERRDQCLDSWENKMASNSYGGRVYIEIYANEDDAKQRYDELKAQRNDNIDAYLAIVLKNNTVIFGDMECVKDAK